MLKSEDLLTLRPSDFKKSCQNDREGCYAPDAALTSQ